MSNKETLNYENIYRQSMNISIVSSHIFPYKECIFTQYAHCTETSCAWQQCEEACPLKLYNPYSASQEGKGLH